MRFFSVLSALAHLVGASTILQLNGTTYYSPDYPAGSVSIAKDSSSAPAGVLPATYLSKSPASVQDLKKQFVQLLEGDDVISESFLSTIILSTEAQLSTEVKGYLKSAGVAVFIASSKPKLPSGPYFLHPSGSLTRVYRLYVDTNMAFVQGVIQGQNGQYLPSVAAAHDSVNAAISIPIPSRHYYPKPSSRKPLSGLRIGVKDVIDLKGIKTGGGSRAYFALYPPVNTTASSLQRLIDLGAVVVGKLKTSQFAIGERPTANYVDQLAPFNPRGDGYQSPSASSCGPGAAMASYDWLDLGLGTDTTGSIRGPSAANGVFGMRITNASLPLDGILPISAAMDTPGLIARDAKLLQEVYTNWFQAKAKYSSFPKRIILPDEFWASVNKTTMPVYDKFLKDFSTLIGAKVEHVNTNNSFIEHTGNKEGILAFTTAIQQIMVLDQWNRLGKPFFSDYQNEFGRTPFVDPVLRMGLALAPNVTPEVYTEAQRRLQVYRKWFTSQLVPSCESSLVIYPLDPGLEVSRDDSLREDDAFYSLAPLLTQQAAYAGVPDYAVPIGVRKFKSPVSMIEEELPVSVGIISGAGCDHMLLDLIVKHGEKNDDFKTKVNTGRTLW
ncbi:hypothetical protein NW762_007683 [Fusarium torreyae]|uniref:Amidase domain-containing protein n=1 Tax=Fusarium torreyae TaxID=1237075 RepID=A0A9W8RZS8_9HYPO|nr:hypothetical protein NW762_007683 [Fusarium torreyae]